MLGVKKCIVGKPSDPTPVFDTLSVPEWLSVLHADDARREKSRLIRLSQRSKKMHIGPLDDIEKDGEK
ncbi:hypothetical protein MNBD_GAMMA12-2631 [hydrothermal vent metagenome]|uniref:Uncharacterized protein n=1 Tax=hydrothermal vent metagenome TaxID=652676 RepID=A0A3B0ZP01_9ZZZZ